MSKNISDKDKKAWKKFISSDEKIHNKDENFKQKKLTRTRVLDLHGYTLDEANKKIEKLIINSYKEKVNKSVGNIKEAVKTEVENKVINTGDNAKDLFDELFGDK